MTNDTDIRELISLTPARKQEIDAAVALLTGLSNDERCAVSFAVPDNAAAGINWRPDDDSRVCYENRVYEISRYSDRKQIAVKLKGEYIFDTTVTLLRDTLGSRGRETLKIPAQDTTAIRRWLDASIKSSATDKLRVLVGSPNGYLRSYGRVEEHQYVQTANCDGLGRTLQEICLWALEQNFRMAAQPMARIAKLIGDLQAAIAKFVATDEFLDKPNKCKMPSLPEAIIPKLMFWEMAERHKA